jgi:hypothetical protein
MRSGIAMSVNHNKTIKFLLTIGYTDENPATIG